MIPSIGHSGKGSGCQGPGSTTKGYKGILGRDGNILYPDCGVDYMRYVKTQNPKRTHFTVYKFYLNKLDLKRKRNKNRRKERGGWE